MTLCVVCVCAREKKERETRIALLISYFLSMCVLTSVRFLYRNTSLAFFREEEKKREEFLFLSVSFACCAWKKRQSEWN